VLTVVSIGLALAAQMPAKDIMAAYETGVGKTLGHIALVVALGTMLGKMMAERCRTHCPDTDRQIR
jgi:GntP family gluconate:H+ symporter